MNDVKIVIDAGHGGSDPGAVGNGIIEKEYTLKISKYIADKLKELGANVYLTRTTDETLSPTQRTNRVLNAFGNSKDVIVISNHINAGGGDGAEVIYALRNDDALSRKILDELAKEGQNIRSAFQRRLPSDQTKDYYFMLRNTGNTEAIIIEYGFLDSTKDDVIQLKNNWQNYADAVVRALADYLNLKSPTTNTYTVKVGDSLWNIAKKYNTSVDKLKKLNKLSSNLLTIGQHLVLPSTDNTTYTVVSGDTLYKIAEKNNTSVDELMKLNNLTTNLLSIGQILTIPYTNTKLDYNYIVKAGDSLWSIASNYNSTVQEIKNLNKLSSDILTIGQKLLLPTSVPEQTYYTVKSGDTLYSIASKFNTTVQNIKSINNLTSNNLSIGQTLLI